jgi:hypothetical protein
LFMAGVMFLGSTPTVMQPSASARMNEPTSSGLSNPATTPVERTTKLRSSVIVRPAALCASSSVCLTSSPTDSRVNFFPSSVLPKTFSPSFGGLTSRDILTVLLSRYVLPVSRFVAVRMHFVVVLPISTEATT